MIMSGTRLELFPQELNWIEVRRVSGQLENGGEFLVCIEERLTVCDGGCGWYIIAVNRWHTIAVNGWYICGCYLKTSSIVDRIKEIR